jgi:hypothetical protein
MDTISSKSYNLFSYLHVLFQFNLDHSSSRPMEIFSKKRTCHFSNQQSWEIFGKFMFSSVNLSFFKKLTNEQFFISKNWKKKQKKLPGSRSYLHRTFLSSDWMKKVVERWTQWEMKRTQNYSWPEFVFVKCLMGGGNLME